MLCNLRPNTSGVSLHLVPTGPHYRVDVGGIATIQCVLNGNTDNIEGTFSWIVNGSSQALRSTEDGRVTIFHSELGTVSALVINSVHRGDKGVYTCSYSNLMTVSITLDVVCKLVYIVWNSIAVVYSLHTCFTQLILISRMCLNIKCLPKELMQW